MQDHHNIEDLFDRYRKGEATPEEKAIVAAWLAQLDALEQPLPEERIAAYAERSRAALRQPDEPVHEPIQEPIQRRINPWIKWTAAAALMVAILTPLYLRHENQEKGSVLFAFTNNPTLLLLADGSHVNLDHTTDSIIHIPGGTQISIHNHEIRYTGATSAQFHTLITGGGKRYKVVLPDQTSIWLNANSRLKYPVQFAKDQRRTEVSGEAYFEVAKAESWPFIVQSKDITVSVLGTAFNISAYPDSVDVHTTLLSGSVALDVPGQRKVLQPSQKATYNDRSFEIKTIDAQRDIDWVYNRLVFRETSIREVLNRLSLFYNVQFNVKNTHIFQYTFTGTFEDKPLERVLEYMQITSKISYSIKNNVIELK